MWQRWRATMAGYGVPPSLCVLEAYSFQYFTNNHKNVMYVGIKHNEQFWKGR